MTRLMSVTLAAGLVLGLGRLAVADDQDAKAVIDKAVKALGGAEKLGAAKIVRWKTKGKISRNDEENAFSTKVTAQGIDKVRQEFEGEFGGNPVKGVTILDGDKGWRKFGDETNALEGDQLANQKRTAYLQLVPEMPLLLKGEGFKVEAGEEEKVGRQTGGRPQSHRPRRQGISALFRQGKRPARQADRNGRRPARERVRAGNDLRQLQGLRRHQAGHEDRVQTQRQEIHRARR